MHKKGNKIQKALQISNGPPPRSRTVKGETADCIRSSLTLPKLYLATWKQAIIFSQNTDVQLTETLRKSKSLQQLHIQTIHFPFLYVFFATAACVRNEISERQSRKQVKKWHHTTIHKQFTVQLTVKASFVENAVSWPCSSVCLALVCSIAFAAVIWPWEPWGWLCQRYSWIVHALSSHVHAACSLLCLAWQLRVQFL